MSQDISMTANLGPAAINIGATDVGHTDDAGVKATAKINIVTAFAGKYGKSPIRKYAAGMEIKVEFVLIQTVKADLAVIMPGATLITSGGFSKLTFGSIAGKSLTSFALKISPFISANNPLYELYLPVAVSVGDFEMIYTGGEGGWQKWKVTCEGMVNEASGSDGNYLFTFGDHTITTDAVAPTISTVLPAAAATGQSVGTAVVWTISENLDASTVDVDSVILIKDPAGTPVAVAGSVVLVNAGAGTTITFTPTSSLTAAKVHGWFLDGNRIKDQNGNLIVGTTVALAGRFTTA